MGTFLVSIILLLSFCLSGCGIAHRGKTTTYFWGWGSHKWPDGQEIKSEPPIKLPSFNVEN